METVGVEGAVAFVRTDFPAARPKELARSEMPTEWVQFAFWFHGVNITSSPGKSVD
jgi:hypothetical protein